MLPIRQPQQQQPQHFYIYKNLFETVFPSGHTRQGLRCRNCKSNVHVDCAAQLTKCQAKQKLLRRQKSTSEIVTNRVDIDDSKLKKQTNNQIHRERESKKMMCIMNAI